MSWLKLLAFFAIYSSIGAADDSSTSLNGTWSSKSNTVFTGPGFYDPIDELLIEPALPGISYSFHDDGYFEEAIYQVTPNPKNHSCAVAALIFQHGTYEVNSSGSIILTPFAVDGRQLLSDPCNDNGVSVYSRYSQKEIFKSYAVSLDSYHGRYKLQLYESDGSPMQPLYLAYRPPQMLPTITMNPTANSTDSGSTAAASSTALSKKVKRSLENRYKTNAVRKHKYDYDLLCQTRTVRKQTNSLTLQSVVSDVEQQGGQRTVNGTSVHVSNVGSNFQRSTNSLLVETLGSGDESLLQSLVSQRALIFLGSQLSVNIWVLRDEVWLVEVVCVLHESTSDWLESDWSIRTNQHSNSTCTTGWSGSTFLVNGNVSTNDDRVSSIPSGRFHPVNGIKHGVGTTVTSVQGVNTFDVGVLTKQLHQDRLGTLTLVEQSLCSHL
ncbi:hypothetical protein OGAPHI_005465 [Ogataea philodendri]|uniref:Protein ROT1 n=1 Tax=Ogataea philodendri TaxID=1378263 RepID=A0A9P8NZS3_9ASCO|nr:uncharacterized protein OGAPHI_005465 [Ogataea philodendri]KAH3662217.1 hypothetical protein OGAPHI_005465 [Ogataea philodendri]